MTPKRTLLLNADYVPLRFIDEVRAIKLLIREKATVVDVGNGASLWDDCYTYANGFVTVPAIIRLIKRVGARFYAPRFCKRVVFARDTWCCQYCGVQLTTNSATIDHVVPQSKGGRTSWMNCVASCKQCNRKKKDKTVVEAGMLLLNEPFVPSESYVMHSFDKDVWHNDWSLFLQYK